MLGSTCRGVLSEMWGFGEDHPSGPGCAPPTRWSGAPCPIGWSGPNRGREDGVAVRGSEVPAAEHVRERERARTAPVGALVLEASEAADRRGADAVSDGSIEGVARCADPMESRTIPTVRLQISERDDTGPIRRRAQRWVENTAVEKPERVRLGWRRCPSGHRHGAGTTCCNQSSSQ
jgi:hypothetical protein